MTEERKPMRPNPRFSSPVATVPGEASKPTATVRPRPNTPLILAAREGALPSAQPAAPALTRVDGEEQEPLPAAPVAVTEEPAAALEAPSAGPQAPVVPEPTPEHPEASTEASTASGAPEVDPPPPTGTLDTASAPGATQAQGRGEKRSIPSPGILGKWMDSVFGESDPDSQASGGGRLKYNLNFPPAMHEVIEKTGKVPGTLAREAAVWALDKDPIMITKDLVTRCARKIAEGRKRANNPTNLTYPVTLNIPGSYTSAVGIATKRCDMAPVPYFEAISVLYAGFLLSEQIPIDNNQQNADGVN